MAVKAVAQITEIQADADNKFKAYIHFIVLDPAYADAGENLWVYGLPGTILDSVLESTIKSTVQTRMEVYGPAFGLLDSVRLLGVVI